MSKLQPTSRTASWPRLSERLTGPRDRHHCQACGAANRLRTKSELSSGPGSRHLDNVTGWIEHDHNDTPEPIVVFLCCECATRLIEPHVRLYRELEKNAPMPGAMPLCDNCRHRDGVRCANPQAKINGGPGLKVKQAPPSRGFWDSTRNGRRVGGQFCIYTAPPSACNGHELKP